MVGSVGVAAALRPFPDLGNHWITGHGREEAVEVDTAKTLGKGEMLLGRQLLVAEEDDAMLAESTADFGQHPLWRRLRQVDARYLGAECRRKRLHPDIVIRHGSLHWPLSPPPIELDIRPRQQVGQAAP